MMEIQKYAGDKYDDRMKDPGLVGNGGTADAMDWLRRFLQAGYENFPDFLRIRYGIGISTTANYYLDLN